MAEDWRGQCWQCRAEIRLPFAPQRSKLCNACYLKPRPRCQVRRVLPGEAEEEIVDLALSPEERRKGRW